MTTRIFTLPDLGEGLAEAELVRWLVAEGDTIAVDQPIAEVETAKSVVEVPSPYAGVVQTLHGAEGEALTVGEPLVSVGEPLVSVAEPLVSVGEPLVSVAERSRSAAPSDELSERASSTGSGNVLVGYGTTETTHTMRRRRRRVTSSAPAGRVASVDSTAPTTPPAPTAPIASKAPIAPTAPIAVSSPVVRQLARTRGLDLATVSPTGPDGTITRHDVEAALAGAAGDTATTLDTAAALDTATTLDTAALGPGTGPLDVATGLPVRSTTPLSLFRRTVAATMARSRSEIPEATVWVDVDATDLLELRGRIRIGDRHPSIVALISRFTLTALTRYPVLAARLTPDATSLIEFDGVNLGVAADTERGLVVPVIRAANTLSLRELDAEVSRLAGAARAGTAAPAELAGSTFTINNYGTLGVDGSAAIINHPEVAILGIGRLLGRPWVVNGEIVPRSIVQLSLVFDHRVCDGGTAAGFLRMIADAIEHPYDAFADV